MKGGRVSYSSYVSLEYVYLLGIGSDTANKEWLSFFQDFQEAIEGRLMEKITIIKLR